MNTQKVKTMDEVLNSLVVGEVFMKNSVGTQYVFCGIKKEIFRWSRLPEKKEFLLKCKYIYESECIEDKDLSRWYSSKDKNRPCNVAVLRNLRQRCLGTYIQA